MKEIKLDYTLSQLHTYLEDNPRGIVSAAFGNGKTTLLKQYMEAYGDESEFLVLHPVNYSCGSNEDVFEYIKRDILFQLANKGLLSDIDLDAIDATVFSWENLRELIGFFISLAPGGERLAKLWDKFQPWLDKAMETKSKYEDEKHTFDKYNSLFTSQRGGIFEHDAYTVLIEKTLEIIHSRNITEGAEVAKNKSVLIVEDMDRIDPAHLFRILNVLGAHLDQDEEQKNKFGFKNILLVLDYDVTEHIFHHFYGEKSDYVGYMTKFLTHNIFRFSIEEAARNELTSVLATRCLVDQQIIRALPVYGLEPNIVTLGSVIDRLCVRQVAHILDDLDSQIYLKNIQCGPYVIDPVAPITIVLSVLVRLNQPVNYGGLCDFINRFPWGVTLYQQYLLHEDIFTCGAPFMIDGHVIVSTAVKNSDETSTAKIENSYSSGGVERDVSRQLNRCFGLAKGRVKGII